ncbi:unnamed protein product [Didymodactylos carnosus]|uniref:Eukaryotic translation initiation factor 2 subunit 1 n=1 Tax=Didymodactylos carnosus TaxID=1234261 RepID=A0A814JVK3_9BILA|nr:unnamed protein product [Didymodactylos carnosus]CAF1042622.1 unnamed protein product [Didymodactylos carnosus]CAF3744733.1 unnamed protein product [Didymodactylos carnosus]CAF3812777.1 unnamed protein product [Didymodactylos carnosus]
MTLNCRFYENKLPDNNDLVMVNVVRIENVGVYVKLLEYDNIEGMILMSELSRRRIRSVNKLVRIGRNEVARVIRVDLQKGYIDLSKSRVLNEDEVRECEQKYIRGRTVNSVLRQTAHELSINNNDGFEQFYKNTAWFYDRKYKYSGACYDVFKQIIKDETEINNCSLDQQAKEILSTNIRRRFMPRGVIKCRAGEIKVQF